MAINSNDFYGSLQAPTELGGIFRARVENNVDPLGIGRVQVRVPMIHRTVSSGGTATESLPWASYCSSIGGGYNYGSFIIPEIGEYVWVMFEDMDSNKPVYLGSVFGTDSTLEKKYGSEKTTGIWSGVVGANEVPLESQRESPTHKMVYKSRHGSMLYFDTDEKTNSVGIEDANDQKFKISSAEGKEFILMEGENNVLVKIHNGKIDIGYEGGRGIQVIPDSGDIVLKASGATITLSDSITMKADSVNVKSSSFKVNSNSIRMQAGSIKIIE